MQQLRRLAYAFSLQELVLLPVFVVVFMTERLR